MVNIDKSRLEKTAKRCDFSAKYISLPCLVVSLVVMMAALVAGNQSLFVLNLFMCVFNAFAYWINTATRDRCLDALDSLGESDRLQKIRDLNPNKR
jgi:hypothetical protein